MNKLILATSFLSFSVNAAVYESVQPGAWNDPATWGGAAPPYDLGADFVSVLHRVESGATIKLVGPAKLTVDSAVLVFTAGGLVSEHPDAVVNMANAVVSIPDGNFINKNGRVEFFNSDVRICDDNYTDEASQPDTGTFGDGRIYVENGNVEDKELANSFFSSDIAWCAPGGNGVDLPTPENCEEARPENGCYDEELPTFVVISNVSFAPHVMKWETIMQVGTIGFHVEKGKDGNYGWTRLNEELLPAMIDSPMGAQYHYVHVDILPGVYRLVELEAHGNIRVYGPFEYKGE